MIVSPLMRRSSNQGVWNPFDVFRRELEGWVGNGNAEDRAELIGNYPVDIHEDANFIHVDAEMPGFKKEDIDVTLENGILTIAAQRKTETEKKGESHLSERRFTRVSRAFTLPNSVHDGKVEATLADGVLHLKLHKREEVKPKKIEVK